MPHVRKATLFLAYSNICPKSYAKTEPRGARSCLRREILKQSIAALFHCDGRVIDRLIGRFQTNGKVHGRSRAGLPRVTSPASN